MDQNKKQIFIFSKKGIQILLSLSVLAFISSQYSSLFSSYLSSMKFFSYSNTDRHYIFLLCNGLMLLVIKTSGLFATPTPPGTEFYRDTRVFRKNVELSHHQSADFSEHIHVKNNDQSADFNNKNNVKLQTDHHLSETKVVAQVEEAETVMDQGGEYVTSTAQYEEKEEAIHLNIVDGQEDDQELGFVNAEEEEEQGIMLWSTEELNKKCDDFIRKMKYGIKFEAPLVMV